MRLSIPLTALLFAVSITSAQAAPFTVDRTDDSADAGAQVCSGAANDCSLRGAIIKANTTAGADEILLPASATPYAITIPRGAEGFTAGDLDAAVGDLDITEALKITGDGADTTVIEATGTNDRVFMANLGGTGSVEISGVKITGGNSGFRGGAIWAFNSALTLTDSFLTGNTAIADGGGLSADNGSGTNLILSNSTISDNSAGQSGGGIFHETGNAFITNTTISGNTVTGAAGFGGAIRTITGTLTLINTTIVGNKATDAAALGGGVYAASTNPMVFKNSLISGNTVSAATAQNCAVEAGKTITSQGYNLSSDASCATFFNGTGDQNSLSGFVDDTLADNGGPTPTHLIPDGSPAIDLVPAASCTDKDGAALTSDQRGSARPEDGDGDGTADCDAGAVEIEAASSGTTAGGTTAGGTTAGTGGGTGGTSSGGSGGGCSLIR